MFRSIRVTFAFVFIGLAAQASALVNHGPKHPQDGQNQGSQGVSPTPKPEFLIHAQKELESAEAALQLEQKALEQLREEEVRLRQAAILKSGSWIEPADMWKRKQLLKQSIEMRQHAVANAKRRLTRAENEARSVSESNWGRHHRPSWFRSWWQW
jgi:hypothetical protein